MPVRQTSIDVYNEIRESGVLSEKRWEVYDALYRHGPHTSNEIWNIIKNETGQDMNFNSNSAARMTELREMGCIEELEVRECSITGKNVTVWQTTNNMPIKYDRKEKTIPRSHLLRCREVLLMVWEYYPETRNFIKKQFEKDTKNESTTNNL